MSSTRIIPARAGFTGAEHGFHISRWIIPARAGFTFVPHAVHYSDEDHPRSRGVYYQQSLCPCGCGGSSPLARGLPHVVVGAGRQRRIIPARAGFTPAGWPRSAGRACQDHPRSRGVYGVAEPFLVSECGSSPLARGLPPLVCVAFVRFGIIPARAGFTNITTRVTRGRADHPRSRGVYPPLPPLLVLTEGSSPLARGLPAGRITIEVVPGIIPARAGFT